jgi:hypothetical protein
MLSNKIRKLSHKKIYILKNITTNLTVKLLNVDQRTICFSLLNVIA